MDLGFPILSATIFLPAIGGALLLLMRREEEAAVRAAALTFAVVTFILSLPLLFAYDASAKGAAVFQFVDEASWVPEIGIRYKVGVDGVSLLLVILTTFLGPIGVLCSWRQVTHRAKEFYASLLFLVSGIIGVFCAMDLLLFYVFWEVMLVPMFLIIGVWGGERRVYAAVKFFIYTMAGSLLMFVAILYLYFKAGASTFDMQALRAAFESAPLSRAEQVWLFLAFGLAFAIKVPLFPFHTWLPDAHTEAPTAGSVILAAVLLKMGTYGFLRLAIPLFPEAAALLKPVILAIAVLGIIYGALMALAQDDVKRLIAYSSVSHLGFVVLGIFIWNEKAVTGAVFQMVAHGLSTGALFLFVGALYERRHTRRIADFGGLARATPALATVFLIAALASMGLPGLVGFVGEFLILLGTFEQNRLAAASAALGVVLGAVYLLVLYQRVMFGKPKGEPDLTTPDLTAREYVYFVPPIAAMVLLGLYPFPLLRLLGPSVTAVLTSPVDPLLRAAAEALGVPR